MAHNLRTREHDYEDFVREFHALCEKYNVQIIQSFPDNYAIEDWHGDYSEFYLSHLDTPRDTEKMHYVQACSVIRDYCYDAIHTWLFKARRELDRAVVIDQLAEKLLSRYPEWNIIGQDMEKLSELYDEACNRWDACHDYPTGHLKSENS